MTALVTFASIFATPAFATYESVGNFGTKGQLPPLTGPGSTAVNVTGVGGVPAGTVYALTGQGQKVFRFTATGEFEGAFGAVESPRAVAVDPTNGFVYVAQEHPIGGKSLIKVFTAEGEPVTSFGEEAGFGETVAEGPEKIYEFKTGAMAVDGSGAVYVTDSRTTFESRIMVFKPQSPGDFEHYVYSGRSHDIGASHGSVNYHLENQSALDDSGNIFSSGEAAIVKFSPATPATPVCEYKVPGGGLVAMTVNPQTDEIFYFSAKNNKFHQLTDCDAQGQFEEVSSFGEPRPTLGIAGLSINPALTFSAGRPVGALYALDAGIQGEDKMLGPALGDIFAPAEIRRPTVVGESVSSVGTTSAVLGAVINPSGSETRYAFQYITDAAFRATEPDELQSVGVSATAGIFGLDSAGVKFGGPVLATLSAGSKTATALKTAGGTATLTAATGTGSLNGAVGKATSTSGSEVLTSVSASQGTFEIGQSVRGQGIPEATTITAIVTETPLSTQELTLSRPVKSSGAHQTITSGTDEITALITAEGEFEVGQQIEGSGIPAHTTITTVGVGQLSISEPVSGPSANVALKAGSTRLISVVTTTGSFSVGQKIQGDGINSETEITAVNPGELVISRPAEKAGAVVAISQPGPYPLAVGEQIEGPGIPAGTKIASVQAGQLTLSNVATASGSGVLLRAGLPADATSVEVRRALEGLATIGPGNVEVSGGPGDVSGANPYEVRFIGVLGNTDVPQIGADNLSLSGGSATVTVATEHDGGNGFSVGAIEAPIGGALLGGGQIALSATATVAGLESDSEYHYRVVAESHCDPDHIAEACVTVGPTQAFHTYPAQAPGLPDGRAYELVSPADKHGGQVFPANPGVSSPCPDGQSCKFGHTNEIFPMQAAPDGNAIAYEGTSFSPAEGASNENEYLARRTGSGWVSSDLSPALASVGGMQGYKAISSDLSRAVIYQEQPPLSLAAPLGFANLYSQTTSESAGFVPLLQSPPPSREPGSGNFKIQYAGASADLSRTLFEANDALTGPTTDAPEAAVGTVTQNNLYESANGVLRLVNVLPGNTETQPGATFAPSHPISDDGSRVFWSAEGGQAYVRLDGTQTLAIPGGGRPLTASADGSKVLLDDGLLFNVNDLSEAPVDLTDGKGGFEGIVGQSEDLSSIFFVDTAVLDETENDQRAVAQPGGYNLYAYRDGTVSYIATLLPADNSIGGATPVGDWKSSPSARTAEASPDGHWVAFLSLSPLTGEVHGGEVKEAYLYDSVSKTLTCPSCNPTGERPLGPTNLPRLGSNSNLGQPSYLIDSGRLFFDTGDSLSPSDTNGQVEDVYEYEPAGVGSCARQGGCVSLLSGGHETTDSNFVAADPSGANVFFTTRDQLQLIDRDNLIDLYDAREGGGIAAETEVARNECQGEACQPQVTAPEDPTPASSSFEGVGNVKEPTASPCPKGKQKKNGKCVKKPAKHPKLHKAKKRRHTGSHQRAAGSGRGTGK